MDTWVGKLTAGVLVVFLSLAGSSVGAGELVMFESDGCTWCETWELEIGVVYHKTTEGKILPLRRVDVDEDFPADLTHLTGIVYTPTFVVMEEGREVGRIIGYPGEDFFWPMLGEIMDKIPEQRARGY